MKKLTYYVAAFALCCGVSQTLTSCVDETEEPDYVKAVREAEMKAEIAKNEKNASVDGQAARAAFTDAYIDAILDKNTVAYDEYMTAKRAHDFAVEQLELAESNNKLFFNAILDGKEHLADLKAAIKTAEEGTYDATNEVETTKHNAQVQKAKDEYTAYEANQFPLVTHNAQSFSCNSVTLITLTSALTEEPSTSTKGEKWKTVYGNYLACQKGEQKAQALLTEKKAIYDAAISAQKTANN